MREREIGIKCICCKKNISLVERYLIPYKSVVSFEGDKSCPSGNKNIAIEKDRVIAGYHCPICGVEYYRGFIESKLRKLGRK